MHRTLMIAAALAVCSSGQAMAQTDVVITSPWGNVKAELADNPAARALAERLPLTLTMRDHMRQEKTGALATPLPQAARQTGFSAGALGLWGMNDFVIYYRSGTVPSPGIVILGKVTGDVSIFDRPGPITIQMRRDTSGGGS